jgi:D-mannonate dehydratase
MYQAAKALHESGYQGYLTPDHRLRVEGDSDWGHRYWAYGLGYNKAVIMSLRSELG